MMDRIITHTDSDTGEYFFSTDHCQETGENFVPCTYTIPHNVVARDSLPDGVVKNKEDLVKIYHKDRKEIPNPNPAYQA